MDTATPFLIEPTPYEYFFFPDPGGAAPAGGGRGQAALAQLHARRRGVRQRPDVPEREAILDQLRELLRTRHTPGLISRRVAARACGVTDPTLRRWLAGEDWPAPAALRRLSRWIKRVS